jgi:ribosomal RNA-processing protein 1
MFMSDKPRNQQRLARDLADLTDVLAPANVIPWLESFWKTMAREWGGIDSLRMDKYLYLVRCYVGKGFDVCSKKKWNTAFVEEYIRMLREDGGPLSSRDSKVPAGLKLHVLDVWVDELEKVDGEKKKADLEQVMGPIKELQKETPVKSVRVRAKETVEDERFVDGKAWKEKDGEESEDHENGQSGNGDDFGGFDD